jgi:hypothetical protein
MDDSVLRYENGRYEVLQPSGAWTPYDPSHECLLHLEELTPAQMRAAVTRGDPPAT